MNAGSLFISIFEKGGKDVVGSLKVINKGMEEAKISAFAVKAAIVGAIFGFERLMSFSARTGAGLKQFANLTGISAEALQRYQHAARQFNVSNESMEASLVGVQKTMGDLEIGKSAPEGLGLVVSMTGFDKDKGVKDTLYTMQKLQEFALKMAHNPTLRNTVLRSFGVGDEVISALTQAAFTKERMSKANIFSNSDVKALDKVNADMASIGHDFQVSMGKILKEVGPELVDVFKELNKIFKEMVPILAIISKHIAKITSFSAKTVLEKLSVDDQDKKMITAFQVVSDKTKKDGFKDPRDSSFMEGFARAIFSQDFFDIITGNLFKKEGLETGVPITIQQTNNYNNATDPEKIQRAQRETNIELLNATRQLRRN